MSKADKIEQTALRILGAGIAAWFILAARNYARRKGTEDYFAEKNNGESTDGVGGLSQRHKDILYQVQVKLHALKGDKQYKTLTKAILDDFEWMKHYADVNAAYGYGLKTLKRLNKCAEDYVAYYGKPGEEYVDLVNEIGWGECAGDRDYVEKAWDRLYRWANKIV